MVRGLIALVIATILAVSGIAQPAYALSGFNNSTAGSPINILGNNNTVNVNPYPLVNGYNDGPDTSNSLGSSIKRGFLTVGGYAIGGAAACYALDTVATMVFPPAAMAAAFCPALGVASSGSKLASEGIKVFAKAR